MIGLEQTQDRTSDIFECLAHSRRRSALESLSEATGPLALADLAMDVTDRETETLRAEMDEETVKRVYMSLYHTHVPKLTDADLAEYDQERDEVALIDYPAELESASSSPLFSPDR